MKRGSHAFLLFACLVSLTFILPGLFAQPVGKEAWFYKILARKNVQCELCPRFCVISPGKRGYCRVRQNQDGKLIALSFGKPVAVHVDPIEKKPLFHFLPATRAFSAATAGCNLNCKFCQNWEISQRGPEELNYEPLSPEELVGRAKAQSSPTIAFTYTEPTVFYEYMLETAQKAHEQGVRTCMHSNGYINEQPLRNLAKYLDAANIDLKGFSSEYYAKMCEGSLEPVVRALKVLKEEGVHVEITNLIIAGYNDDMAVIRKMCSWIKDNLGPDTPLHFSRAYPMYKLPGIIPTPVKTLEQARATALDCGLNYVYIGNVPGHEAENTVCPTCKKVVIRRAGYMVEEIHIKDGNCEFCGFPIKGVWQ
ncbi:MAG: AmmeMemoRadiSam system radical SAM enzyme [Candidatus Omnitrophica bacterium]|nr:AmmeMemoRadiSam system radical SAM enzyme [Candidatus Omnitrophota bacterium]